LTDAIAAIAKPKTTKRSAKKDKPYTLQQLAIPKALAKLEELGLSGEPKLGKDFAAMFPDYFEYDFDNKKLSYKNPKS
jgi:hypothetical protein